MSYVIPTPSIRQRMKVLVLFALIVLVFAASSCKERKSIPDRVPVARVDDVYLYQDELAQLVPQGGSPTDSAANVQKYIENWAKKQLLIKEAESSLSTDEKNFRQELEDYRGYLLIHKFKQKYLAEYLDTSISDAEMSNYYDLHSAEFPLNVNLVKGIYVRAPRELANISQIRFMYKQPDVEKLQRVCQESAATLTDFREEWVVFTDLLSEISLTLENQQDFLRMNRYLESQDSVFYHFMRIDEYKLKNDISPLMFIKSNLRTIILNKRREELLDKLENSVYNEALNYNKVEYY